MAESGWRHEAKYLMRPHQVPALRAAVSAWCRPDPHASGDPPSYTNTTLQLDTPTRSFYRARQEDAERRFKLRIRRYGTSPELSFEIKRKFGKLVRKTRAGVPLAALGTDLLEGRLDPATAVARPSEAAALTAFVRLRLETAAEPVVLVRYRREAWVGDFDEAVRVTFDHRLECRPATAWTDLLAEGRWQPCDLAGTMGAPFSAVILELKCGRVVPGWMQELVRRFSLNRRGLCKYALALRQELTLAGAH